MSYNLTPSQKELIAWLVEAHRKGELEEEFMVTWLGREGQILDYRASEPPAVNKGALDALEREGLIVADSNYRTTTRQIGKKNPKTRETQSESSRRCTLMGRAFEAVDSNFDAPDTSFLTQLTPLADTTSLDPRLGRSLRILGAGGSDPEMWDSAVRTAIVVLEEQIRAVANIDDPDRTGSRLVNDVFGTSGALSEAFESNSAREGYRNLYDGVVGVFRNHYAHRLVDPSPEDGGALIVFINLLLKMTDDLARADS